MEIVEVILGLLAVMIVLVALARRFNIPYPILLVLGGLAIGFVPFFPPIELHPDVVFVLFLPPIIQLAAYYTPIRDFRANLREIGLLAIGLVLVTTAVVAVVAHLLIPDMPWAAAFVLGAIVAPPDAVAATSITERLRLPRRITSIVEGESLVNDATALVAYRVAIAAVVTGSFSLADASMQFLFASIGGVLVGIAVCLVLTPIFRRLTTDVPLYTLLTFLSGYCAYLLAEAVHGSGVLAVVALGVMYSQPRFNTMTSTLRLQSRAVWDVAIFLLNGLIFILIGLQLRTVVAGLEGQSLGTALWYAFVICLTVIVLRVAWTFLGTLVPRLKRGVRRREPPPVWRNVSVVAWMGMRGVVSLAAALALPFETSSGAAFPSRELIIFLTFAVILATLVFQGLTLAPLIHWLGVVDDGGAEREERRARLATAQAGYQRMEELVASGEMLEELAHLLRRKYSTRIDHLSAHESGLEYEDEARLVQIGRFGQELLQAEMGALINLRNAGVINDEVLRRVQYDLDLSLLRIQGELAHHD